MNNKDTLFGNLNIVPNWYALHTKARHEKKVDLRLKEKGIESYLPLNTVYRRWSDRYKKVHEPLFSCYVFVKMALRDRLPALQTDGVVRIVSTNGIPSRIPEEQITAIKNILEKNETVNRAEIFTPGKKVKVMRGILKGLEGTLVSSKNENRLVITIDSINQAISVDIDLNDLETI